MEAAAMAAAWFEEPESGVPYKLAGEELLDLVKNAVREDAWEFTTFGGMIVMRRDPRRIWESLKRPEQA
jgi:hypothetical protein